MNRLTGKVAVITGGSSGIGEATAKLFAAESAIVVIVARKLEGLRRVEAEINAAGGQCLAIAADITSDQDAARVMQTVNDTFGKIDILVNNAGIADACTGTIYCSDELWEKCLAVNQTAVFVWCKEVLPYMEAGHQGSIINVSSIGGVYGVAGVAYSATKRAVIGMTKNIAVGYVGQGIRCNAVCPGSTDTPMTQNMEKSPDPELEAAVAGKFDLEAGDCDPIDIANTILFFASDESAKITGQYIVVDGGMCL